MDKQKLQEVFSDKAYVESIVKMSAEDAAKSLCEKGVEVTADDLMQVRDFIMEHPPRRGQSRHRHVLCACNQRQEH